MKKQFGTMTNAQLGAYLEDKLKVALTTLKKESNFRLLFHRFYDTKSAGAYLPEQPADFLIGCPTGAYLLEAKASFKKESLASCLANAVSSGQAAEAHLWCRTGPNQKSLFVFFCASTEQIEIWDGELVSATFIKPKARLRKEDALHTGPISELKNVLRGILL